LKKHLTKHPEDNGQIIISNRFDQKYSLPALLRENSAISVKQFEKLLDDLKKSGELQKLFKQNGLLEQLSY